MPAAAIASVTSAIDPAPSRSNTDRTVASARCVPSATSSTTSSPRAAAARHAAIGPGSRWCSGRMPLNRCVAVRRRFDVAASRSNPRSTAASTCSADASVWPIDGIAPASTSAGRTSSATPGTSGAIVMVTRCPRAASAIARDERRVADEHVRRVLRAAAVRRQERALEVDADDLARVREVREQRGPLRAARRAAP